MSTDAMTSTTPTGSGAGQSGGVASTAADAASTAKDEAATLAHTTKEQVTNLLGEARGEVRTQADKGASRAAEQLRSWGQQIEALASGRPQEAGQLQQYLRDGQHKAMSYADRLEQRGAQGVMDDVVSFGRRRPGTFLLAAAGVGFAIGRLARAGAFQSNGNGARGAGISGPSQLSGSTTGMAGTAGGTTSGGLGTPSGAAIPSGTRSGSAVPPNTGNAPGWDR